MTPRRQVWLAAAGVSALLLAEPGAGAVGPRQAGRAGRQPPPAAAQPAPAEATLSGVVTDRQTGQPVSRARVELATPDGQPLRAELTDDQGQYLFLGVAPGAYTVRVWKAGYVVQAFGPSGWLTDGPPLEIAAGARLELVDVRLVRGAVISGELRDADGRALAWAIVEALRPQVLDGQVILASIGSAQTDDRGRYRLTALPPGDYYVSAYDPLLEGPALDPLNRRFGPTYYPGVVFVADARRVHVELGGTTENVDFQAQFVPPARVAGRLVTLDRRRLLNGSVIISPDARGQIPLGPSTGALIDPDGSFEFLEVPPGRYVIRARAVTDTQEPTLFGSFVTSVEGVDVTNIEMTLKPGADISGTLEFDSEGGPPPADLTKTFVSAVNADTGLAGGATEGFVGEDRTFRLSAMAGDRLLRLENLPPPWQLRRVLHRGRDITDVPLRVELGEEYAEVRITVTDRVTRLTGRVLDPRGEPIADRVVVAVPVNQSWWRPRGRHIRMTYPDLDGRYSIRGLPPATYFVAAVEPLDEADLLDPRVLEAVAARGTRLVLRDGEAASLDLEAGASEPTLAAR